MKRDLINNLSNKPVKNQSPRKKSRLRPLWITLYCLGGLIVAAAIALWIICASIFNAGHIKNLIEEESGKYLNAKIEIGELDYKFFRTYPWFCFEVDSVTIVSTALSNITPRERELLPDNPDFLASVAKLTGKLNIHALLHHTLEIKDIEIVAPDINLVIVNDSLANYNIAKDLSLPKKRFSLDISEVNIQEPVNISFFTLPDDALAQLNISNFYFIKNVTEDRYKIGFEGKASGRYKNYELPSKVPLDLDLSVKPDLKNLEILLDEIKVTMAGISLNAKGEIILNQSGADLQKADLSIKIEDLFTALTYLPNQILQMVDLPEGLTGRLPFDFTISTLTPVLINKNYINNLSLSSLPPVVSTAKIDDAYLEFNPPKGKKIYADDIYLDARLDYDAEIPENSVLYLNELRMRGEGIDLNVAGQINNLTGTEQIIHADMQFRSPVMETLSYLFPKSGMKIQGLLSGAVILDGNAFNFGKEGFTDIILSGNIDTHALSVKSSSTGNFFVKNLEGDWKAKIPGYPFKNNYKGSLFEINFNTDSLAALVPQGNFNASRLDFTINAFDSVKGSPDPEGNIIFKAKNLNYSSPNGKFNAVNILLTAMGGLISNPSSNFDVVAETTGKEDAYIAGKISHTPLVLEYNGGGILQTLMNLMNLSGKLSIEKGSFETSSYLYPFTFSGMSLATDLNDISLKTQDFSVGKSGGQVNISFEGLRPWLTSYEATPLKATGEINLKNVDINQLSWGYYGTLFKTKQDSVFYVAPMTPLSAADSACVAIPRNLNVDISISSQKAEYMEYSFSPLSTRIKVNNGNATLSNLTVGAPYATAVVDWTYSTEQLNNIYMDLKAKVKNFNFTSFFKTFPRITYKSPEITNFSGNISSDIGCYFNMFPNMFMNSNSLEGSFDISGTELEFAREGKIERITHLMLIEGSEPIKIQNIDLKGYYHNNILQINPFPISFDDYTLSIGGINNIAGNMYYHLALEKSPFHLPFGVSLIGNFKHPEVRLGGTHIDDYRSEMISLDPSKRLNINIMAYLKHGWLLFIEEAAKYQHTQETHE